jgi:hypothetical protein
MYRRYVRLLVIALITLEAYVAARFGKACFATPHQSVAGVTGGRIDHQR